MATCLRTLVKRHIRFDDLRRALNLELVTRMERQKYRDDSRYPAGDFQAVAKTDAIVSKCAFKAPEKKPYS